MDNDWSGEVKSDGLSAHEVKLNKLIAANKLVKEIWSSINEIKNALFDEDWIYAAQLWRELSDSEREGLNIAPTKGGIFTIEETKLMASSEFREAVNQYFKEKNDE
jgi:hypothetical protein